MLRVALALAIVSHAAPAHADNDPLIPLLLRMDRYFQQHESGGVTFDSRYDINPAEAIRQSVVCQVLGYAELFRIQPTDRIRTEVAEHATFLLANLDLVRAHGPFDGMLALALLEAWAVTGEERFHAGAAIVLEEMIATPTEQLVLNGGLMVAMATAEEAFLTGDPAAAQKTHDILAQLPGYQNPDGSFPHWCVGSEDIHYTGWMAEELMVLERLTSDPAIEPMLARMAGFLEARVDSVSGRSRYQEPCEGGPGCTRYYYSRASGCGYDYDTRGWTVEPGYTARLLDRFHSPKYAAVIGFLDSLENGGTLPDLYGFWPPPEDPEYPWTIADTSVANMSIVFWTLAGIATARHRAWPTYTCDPEDDGGALAAPAPDAFARAESPALRWAIGLPNPARAMAQMRFELARAGAVSLVVHDAQGRRIRALPRVEVGAGPREITWDLRDDRGRAVPSGSYLATLSAGAERRVIRLIVTR